MRASRIPVEYEASLLGANEYDEDSMTTTRSILLQLYHPTKAVSLLKWHGFFISQVDFSRIWSGTRLHFPDITTLLKLIESFNMVSSPGPRFSVFRLERIAGNRNIGNMPRARGCQLPASLLSAAG